MLPHEDLGKKGILKVLYTGDIESLNQYLYKHRYTKGGGRWSIQLFVEKTDDLNFCIKNTFFDQKSH